MDKSGADGVKVKIRKNWSYILIASFLILTAVYILIKQDNIYLQIHDYLDSNIAWIKMLKDNNLFWVRDGVVPFLGGINRNYSYSELKVYMWLYMILPTFWAIIAGWYLKIVLAIGSFIFLAKSIASSFYEDKKSLIIWCGFLYGIIPTYPPLPFAFASLPLLLGILIRIRRGFKWRYIAALLCYPLLSDFSIFGIFICGYILFYFFAEWFIKKRKRLYLFLVIAALSAGYIFTEWRLFYTMLFLGEENIRGGMTIGLVDFPTSLQLALDVFIRGYYHCGSTHTYIVLPVCIGYWMYRNIELIRKRAWKELQEEPINWLFCWLLFNSIIYGIDSYTGWKDFWRIHGGILGGLSLARTAWFNPFIWYLYFMLVLCRIKKKLFITIISISAAIVICIVPSTYNHFAYNLIILANEIMKEDLVDKWIGVKTDFLTYKEFYSTNLFEEIKEEINYSDEWSIAYGMHPAVLQYNGIKTLDGYISVYPQEYKDKFRDLIAPELEENEEKRKYFDEWGGRAYLFSEEISYEPHRQLEATSAQLRLDVDILRGMEGRYIFSRVDISNADELGIIKVGEFYNQESPYKIHLYRMDK